MKLPFYIKNTKKYGRGLYAQRNIKKGEVIERSPVISISKKEGDDTIKTVFNFYVYEWAEGFHSALALGYGSLFNHSPNHNVDYCNLYETGLIVFTAKRNIKKGEQLFINYGYDPIAARKRVEKLRIEKESMITTSLIQ